MSRDKKKEKPIPFITQQKLTLQLQDGEEVTGRVYVYEDLTKCLVFKVFSQESLDEYEARKNHPAEKAKYDEYERFDRTLFLNSRNVEIVQIHKEDNFAHEIVEKVIDIQKSKS